MTKRQPKNQWVLGAVLLAAIVIVAIVLVIQPPATFWAGLLRATGLLGYLAVFLSILSSLYLRELVRYFGRSFVQTHHIVALTGLGLLLVHPLAAVIVFRSLRWLVPQVGSLRAFFTWGGPPALYLLILAILTAWQRRRIDGWRIVHYGTYLAFFLATIHAILLGTDVRGVLVAQVLVILLALAAAWVPVYRHWVSPRRGSS
jgi:methionine sulfoxide reductase heme-binding subunit